MGERTVEGAPVMLSSETHALAAAAQLGGAGVVVAVERLAADLLVLRIPAGADADALRTAGVPADGVRQCPSCGHESHAPTARRCPECETPVAYVAREGEGPSTRAASRPNGVALLVALGFVVALGAIVWLGGNGDGGSTTNAVPPPPAAVEPPGAPAPAGASGQLGRDAACAQFLEITATLTLDDDGLAVAYRRLASQTVDPRLAAAIGDVADAFARHAPEVPGDDVLALC